MSAVSSMEEKDGQKEPTFNINLAVNILACSLPFSTILIIGIFSFSEVFINPMVILGAGFSLLLISFIPDFVAKMKKIKESKLESATYGKYVGLNTSSQSAEES